MPAASHTPQDPEQPVPADEPAASPRRRRVLRWVLFAIAALFFLAVLQEAFDPFGEQGYTAISHGDHSHYVPEDRDPNVGIDQFPTRPPGPNERILPDGRIVPK